MLETVIFDVSKIEGDILERSAAGSGRNIACSRVIEFNAFYLALDRDVLGQVRQRVCAGSNDLDRVAGLGCRDC